MVFMYLSGGASGLWMWLGLGVFILASLTDYIDGQIARKCNQVSDFGKFLDPLADKLLTIAALTMFCEWGSVPAWALMIVLTREFAVTGLRLVAVGKGTVIAAGWSGKVKTASSMVGLCVLMAFPTSALICGIVTGVVVVTTVYSGIEYFAQNWKCLWD
jgi:CDP-diacylglycerol--glycerol-3-phosphate 3-phosphatidyltransferase